MSGVLRLIDSFSTSRRETKMLQIDSGLFLAFCVIAARQGAIVLLSRGRENKFAVYNFLKRVLFFKERENI